MAASSAGVEALVGGVRAGPFPSTIKYLANRLRASDVGYRSPYEPLSPAEEQAVQAALASSEAALRAYG